MSPRWMIDLVNSSNNVALGQVLAGEVDLNNNFLPGIATLVQGGYGLHTYFPEAPYMMPANTAWLVLNTTKPPMDDPAFRQALARSIDTSQIVNVVYGNLVQAANPTGLLPTWEDHIDQAVVDELGFSYDPDQARQILADAGYADTDGDGFVETPSGDPISLTLIVPAGWTDWMEAIRVVSEGAQAAGINVTTDFPDFPALLEARNSGNFDMVINNDRQGGSTPWLYYDYVFSLPIQETQVSSNFGRYENQEAADLVDQFDHTPKDDTAEAMQALVGDPAHLPRGAAGDPPVVQRPVGADEHPVLDQLAERRLGEPEHAQHLGRLLEQDRRPHARQRRAGGRRVTMRRFAGWRRRPAPPPPHHWRTDSCSDTSAASCRSTG